VYDVVQLELSALRCCWSIKFFLLHENVMCSVLRGSQRRVEWGEEKERKRRRKMKRGRLGKAKKNQYMSDKKAQILDDSSV
jgi:hypothetical protein